MKGVKCAHPNYVHIWSLEILLHRLLAALTPNPGEPGAGHASLSLVRGPVGSKLFLHFKAFWRIIKQMRIDSPISKVTFSPSYLKKKSTTPCQRDLIPHMHKWPRHSQGYSWPKETQEPKPFNVSGHTSPPNARSDHFWCMTKWFFYSRSEVECPLKTEFQSWNQRANNGMHSPQLGWSIIEPSGFTILQRQYAIFDIRIVSRLVIHRITVLISCWKPQLPTHCAITRLNEHVNVADLECSLDQLGALHLKRNRLNEQWALLETTIL